MKSLQIHIDVSPELYLKNPDSSELGRKIVSNSIEMINELGFEAFTFKKLGQKINSPESSVYRYFENKHILLIYLLSWYWSWLDYRLVFATANIDSPIEKLKKALKVLTQATVIDQSVSHINEVLLSKIVVSESAKAYHTKEVDNENEKGFFKAYKQVVQRVSDLVLAMNQHFEFPHMLISTVIEGAHQQRYFAEHLPSLTDVKKETDSVTEFYTQMVFKVLQ
ncbi:MAG: TetR/AcrR family transcriptional regulator [Polaribacter sp.]|nr:TetR/AcrR family transcriptional regulator [Polaribacter sp.]